MNVIMPIIMVLLQIEVMGDLPGWMMEQNCFRAV